MFLNVTIQIKLFCNQCQTQFLDVLMPLYIRWKRSLGYLEKRLYDKCGFPKQTSNVKLFISIFLVQVFIISRKSFILHHIHIVHTRTCFHEGIKFSK